MKDSREVWKFRLPFKSVRRHEGRFSTSVPVEYERKSSIGPSSPPREAIAKDLSMQGIALQTEELLAPSTRLSIHFYQQGVKGKKKILTIEGVVKRCDKEGESYKAGVSFGSIPKKEKEKLSWLCYELFGSGLLTPQKEK